MRRVAAWLAWFAGLLVLWLLLVGAIQDVEQIAGLVAAAIGATAAEVVRSQGLAALREQMKTLNQSQREFLDERWPVLEDIDAQRAA